MQRLVRCYSTSSQNYYDVLQVARTASAAEIKKAFYTLSKKYHPDITGSNEAATKKFVAIKEAYDILKDTDKRKAYDSHISSGYSSTDFNQGNQQGFRPPPYQQDSSGAYDQRFRNGGWEFRYQQKNGQTFTQEDFERIWRDFQRKTQDPRHQAYDRMFREHRQKVYDDFSKSRAEAWRKRAEEHTKKYPYDNMSMNPSHYINWQKFNRWLIIYVIIFFVIGLFQARGLKDKEEKPRIVYTKTPNERLKDMIYKPPPNKRDDEW